MTVRVSSAVVLLAFSASVMAEDIVIRAAAIYPGIGAPLAPGMVRITDGKIAEVAGAITPPAGAKVIDLRSGVLIPGLIDAHTTVGLDGGISESTMEVTPNFRVLDAVDWSARSFRQSRA